MTNREWLWVYDLYGRRDSNSTVEEELVYSELPTEELYLFVKQEMKLLQEDRQKIRGDIDQLRRVWSQLEKAVDKHEKAAAAAAAGRRYRRERKVGVDKVEIKNSKVSSSSNSRSKMKEILNHKDKKGRLPALIEDKPDHSRDYSVSGDRETSSCDSKKKTRLHFKVESNLSAQEGNSHRPTSRLGPEKCLQVDQSNLSEASRMNRTSDQKDHSNNKKEIFQAAFIRKKGNSYYKNSTVKFLQTIPEKRGTKEHRQQPSFRENAHQEEEKRAEDCRHQNYDLGWNGTITKMALL